MLEVAGGAGLGVAEPATPDEGVVRRAEGYDNPAITALDAGVPESMKKGEKP